MRAGTAVGAVLVGALGLVALAAPWLAPGDPLDLVARPLLPPFADGRVPLGTDGVGRDVAAGLVHGARVSLAVALASAGAALGFGALVGLAAGAAGGAVDGALMRATEAVQAVPPFLLALALVGVLGASFATVVLAIALASWPRAARLTRAEVIRLKGLDWVRAERLTGRHPAAVAAFVLLPAAVQPLFALAGVAVGEAVLVESALAFLGLGDPNLPSWGAMVAHGRPLLRTAPMLVVLPGLAIAATVLGASLLGDAAADRVARRRR